ncbi:hypothetical protein HYU17_04025 [Candidatus Woesearchaeota archaeon]|nr:hypothetical protein [Candidatus Woesearchaeota archaeon]
MFGNGAYEGYTVRLEAAVDKAVSFLVKARYVDAASGKHWYSIRTGLPGKLAEGPCVHLFSGLGIKAAFL